MLLVVLCACTSTAVPLLTKTINCEQLQANINTNTNTMVQISTTNALSLFMIVSLAINVQSTSLRSSSRDLTVCDTLKACYFINLQTREETQLTGNDSFQFDVTNEHGYSVRCDVSGTNGESDYIKFIYDGKVQDEFGLPRYMNGDSDAGAWVNPVPYLATCGKKTLKIEGHVWSSLCFEKTYSIEMKYADGQVCDEVPPAPILAPVVAPVPTPVLAPVPTPVLAPVLTPILGAPTVKTCPTGWKMVDGCCKKVFVCPIDFQCPANSQRIPGRQCYNGFTDCECLPGFIRSDNRCVKVVPGCTKDFQCPANSTRRANRDCYNDFNDCKCNQGYYKDMGQCVPTKWCP
jgi:hypothetical protein